MPALSCRKSVSGTMLIGTRVVPFMMDGRGIPWEKEKVEAQKPSIFV